MGLDAPGDDALWAAVRDHCHGFFADTPALTRLSLPRGARFEEETALIEWGGCQAWLHGVVAAPTGALATVFDRQGAAATHPAHSGPDDAAAKYERRLRRAFDPDGIFNPGLNAEQ